MKRQTRYYITPKGEDWYRADHEEFSDFSSVLTDMVNSKRGISSLDFYHWGFSSKVFDILIGIGFVTTNPKERYKEE